MNFTRGKEVNDALDLGVKKDAIRITGITYILNEKEHTITNSRKMEIFIKRFCEGDLPNDVLFGIERILFFCVNEKIEESLDTSSINIMAQRGHIGMEDIPKKYKIVPDRIEYPLGGVLGQTINIYDTLLIMPTEEELEKTGFSHLMELEEAVVALGKDYVEIRNQLAILEAKEREKEYERMDRELSEDRKKMEAQIKKEKAGTKMPKNGKRTFKIFG